MAAAAVHRRREGTQAIRNTFGVAAAIQRCQVHKGRNIIERLPQHLHASVKKALRQPRTQTRSGSCAFWSPSGSIPEPGAKGSLAGAAPHQRTEMALRWTAAGLLEAQKTFGLSPAHSGD